MIPAPSPLARLVTLVVGIALLLGAVALLASVSPALAGDRPMMSQREIDARIAGCIRTYGQQYRDRCVEILEGPSALGRRARHGYEWRRLGDEIEREDRCRDDPATVAPRPCFDRRHGE